MHVRLPDHAPLPAGPPAEPHPPAAHPARTRRTLRAIAAFEALKGVVVLTAGLGALGLLHRDANAIAAEIASRLHLDPTHAIAHALTDLASQVDDGRIRVAAVLASLYAAGRFVEAWGLWRERRWAEWLAVLSGAAFVPLELLALARGITPARVLALVINLAVIGVLGAQLAARRKN